MTDFDGSDWEPQALGGARIAGFDRLRDHGPAVPSRKLGLGVFGYDDIVAISADPDTFSNVRLNHGEAAPAPMRGIPLEYDPPEHTRYRRMLMPLFSASRLKAFTRRLDALAERDLAVLLTGAPVEVVAGFADPFPVRVICELLGWDLEDWRTIKAMSEAVRVAMAERDAAKLDAAHGWWRDYTLPVVEARRRAPRDDATSWLLRQTIDGRALSDDELMGILRLLLVAGHGTTTASLGIIVAYLASHPADQAKLRAEPQRVPRAIEEILRWFSPLAAMARTATRDTTVAGRTVRAGERVALVYAAANRDPGAFEDADRCVIDRTPNRHLVFGSGIHGCLGSPLARLELKLVVTRLLAATRGIELVGRAPQVLPRSWPTNDLEEFSIRCALA